MTKKDTDGDGVAATIVMTVMMPIKSIAVMMNTTRKDPPPPPRTLPLRTLEVVDSAAAVDTMMMMGPIRR